MDYRDRNREHTRAGLEARQRQHIDTTNDNLGAPSISSARSGRSPHSVSSAGTNQ